MKILDNIKIIKKYNRIPSILCGKSILAFVMDVCSMPIKILHQDGAGHKIMSKDAHSTPLFLNHLLHYLSPTIEKSHRVKPA